MKIGIKQSFPCEFGVSLEILQTLSKLGQLFWDFLCYKKRKQNEFGESPNSLQTLSKLKKKYACTIFFQETYACSQSIEKAKKSLCTHILFWVWREFGEILEILQTHFVFVIFANK